MRGTQKLSGFIPTPVNVSLAAPSLVPVRKKYTITRVLKKLFPEKAKIEGRYKVLPL
jgi:hypothetical protein